MKRLVLLLFVVGLTRCASLTEPSRATVISADFFVSTVTGGGSGCVKQHCAISLANNEVMLASDQHNVIVNRFTFIQYLRATGVGTDGKEWEVLVGNLRKEPYLLLLKTDSIAILVGYECY